MNDLFKILIQDEKPVNIFPIREYWIDVGEIKSFDQACKEYANEFSEPFLP